ncbi:MAG: sigma-70 family RNA polymerase sigma factor [Lachnospiraceae bacterium]|nr:sigma-70 family RNA polymerase sigma factor [Lachnospiraceae bacterium]
MNKKQFTAQVLEAEKSLYHIAKSILKNDDDCADAMQNAILHAFEKLHTLRNEMYFKTWLTRILINECNYIIRSRKAQVPYEDYCESLRLSQHGCPYGPLSGRLSMMKVYHENRPDNTGIYYEDVKAAAGQEDYPDVFEAVMELDEHYRIPLVLFYVEEFSIKEICRILKLSQGTVKTRLYRGRRLLKEKLEGVYGYEKKELVR